MNDSELNRNFLEIRNSIDELTQGLHLIREGLETQTEMLAKILEVATEEPKRSPIADTLNKILTTLDTQTQVLVRFGELIGGIGPDIENSVMRGIHRATGAVDENGEIITDTDKSKH